ncbi:MAG: hypothetical protein K2M13_03935 [Muribaculaceae bacterium]|nr:hypothetical protein [Muribaculaceae bacterium]
MNTLEKKMVFGELRRLMEEMREQIKGEIRAEIKAASRDIYDVLTGLGVIEPEEKMWTKADIIKKYCVSKTTVEKMMTEGVLPFCKDGNTQQSRVRFRPADVRIAFQEYNN